MTKKRNWPLLRTYASLVEKGVFDINVDVPPQYRQDVADIVAGKIYEGMPSLE